MAFKQLSLAAGLGVVLSTPVVTQNLAADLQRAKQREVASGDCKSLLPEYTRIAEQGVKSDRGAAAEALIRMGMCHEQLGDGLEQRFYARVASEFADIRAIAAEAGRRLKKPSIPAADRLQTPSRHLAWTKDRALDVKGRISANGRYLPFSARVQGAVQLLLHDMVTGTDRQLTSTPPGGQGASPWDGAAAISTDGRLIAFSWDNAGNQFPYQQEVRVLELHEAGKSDARTIFAAEPGEMLYPHDWTPDHNFIAMEILRADSLRVGLLSVKDGSFRVHRTLASNSRPGNGASTFVSPDGKYLAFDFLTAGKPGRDIVIIDLASNADVATIAHAADDALVGWSADGNDVLFASDRSGAWALWSSAFRPGFLPETPRLIARDINPIDVALGVTASGEIWSLRKARGSNEVRISSLDFGTGQVLSAPADVAQEYLGTNLNPSWSPDGHHLAYVSIRGTLYVPRVVLVVRSLTTNEVREVRPELTDVGPMPFPPAMLWLPDGQSIILAGTGTSGPGFYRVDVKTGDTSLVAGGRLAGPSANTLRLPFGNRSLSADGRRLYYQRSVRLSGSIVERNFATGAERVVCTISSGTAVNPLADLSPDGRFAYCMRLQRDSDPQGPRVIIETDLTTGATREMPAPRHDSKIWVSPDGEWIAADDRNAVHFLRARSSTPAVQIATESGSFVAWSPDSKAVVLANGTEVWWTPIDGRARRKLEGFVAGLGIGPFKIHPDGRRIAQTHAIPPGLDEVWVLRGVVR